MCFSPILPLSFIFLPPLGKLQQPHLEREKKSLQTTICFVGPHHLAKKVCHSTTQIVQRVMRIFKCCGWPHCSKHAMHSPSFWSPYRIWPREVIRHQLASLRGSCPYANMSIPDNPKVLALSSNLIILGTQIEFTLSNLCQILDLLNAGNHCYLTVFDDLPAW